MHSQLTFAAVDAFDTQGIFKDRINYLAENAIQIPSVLDNLNMRNKVSELGQCN